MKLQIVFLIFYGIEGEPTQGIKNVKDAKEKNAYQGPGGNLVKAPVRLRSGDLY